MRYEFNKELVANINHWNMEIDDSGFVYLLHDNWHSEAVCSPYSRLYLVSDGEGQIDAGEKRLLLRPGYAYFIPAGFTFSYSCADYLEKLYFHLRLGSLTAMTWPTVWALWHNALLKKNYLMTCSGNTGETAGKMCFCWNRRFAV